MRISDWSSDVALPIFGRFGFSLPMDETEAHVLIDLSGRPYSVFEGSFEASHIGTYPTEMTPHIFRSLADSLAAAIHVRVTGANDHHKTEACFKAFGRALRQAVSRAGRSEEHTPELPPLMRISYAVFCLQTKTILQPNHAHTHKM